MNPNLNTASPQTAEARNRNAALLAKACAGDKKALGEIYSATYPEVWRTVRSLIKNEDDALDVLQDTYLKAFSRLGQLRDAEHLLPWLRQTAANTARDDLRQKKPALFSELLQEDEEALPFDLPDEGPQTLPEAALDRKETRRLVNRMLDSLSDAQRLVVGMYYYQELPVKTIAEQLDLPENTVKSQLRYAREKIEKQVKHLEQQGVKLYGAAPMAIFRTLFRRSVDSKEPKALGRLTRKISTKGTEALHSASAGSSVKAVTAKAMAARRIGAAAAAVAVAGGAAAGILLERNAHTRYRDERPTVVVNPEPNFDSQYDDNGWKEGFLGLLAGTAETEDVLLSWMVEQVPTIGKQSSIPEDEEIWYLSDINHDNVPELIWPGCLDRYLGVFYWENGRIVPDAYYFDYFGRDSTAEKRALLYTDTGETVFYSTGTTTLSMVPDDTSYYSPFHTGTGADSCDLPDYGLLSEGAETSYEAIFEAYTLESRVLTTFTLTDSGDTYYLLNSLYLSEAEYRELEQSWLSKATWRILDETDAPQLQTIPGTSERFGPFTSAALVDLLGGFDDRPEWNWAKTWLEQPATDAMRYTAIARNQDALLEALQTQYPDEALGAGTWQFAAWSSGNGQPSHRLWVLYRQTPEEGGCCFLAAETGDSTQKAIELDFDRFCLADRMTFYYDANRYEHPNRVLWKANSCDSVSILRTVETDAGSCSTLFNDSAEVVSDAEKPLRQIRFVSAEELADALADNSADITQGLGAPVTVKKLLRPDASVGKQAWMALFLEHPELAKPETRWMQEFAAEIWPEMEWEAALTAGPQGQTLLIRGWKSTEDGGDWALLTVDEDGLIKFLGPWSLRQVIGQTDYVSDTPENLEEDSREDRTVDPAWASVPTPDRGMAMYAFCVDSSQRQQYGWKIENGTAAAYVTLTGEAFLAEEVQNVRPLTFRSAAETERLLIRPSAED